MKVYAVWYGMYEDRYIGELFTTRELAEKWIERDSASLRRKWKAAQRLAGKPRTDAFWIQKAPDGSQVLTPKTHQAPPSWESYLAQHDRGEIEEYDVLEKLP